MKSSHVLYVFEIILLASSAFGESLIPPPIPEIQPIISEFSSSDQDGDKISDGLFLESRLRGLFLGGDEQPSEELVDVELIFKEQITQQQIDDFLLLGGEITYIYKGISYGWNGRTPYWSIEYLPFLMGPTLVHVENAKIARRHMDMATQTGRVRKVWQPGFAHNSLGFDGDENITIGIIDSGVDDSHRDLTGRSVRWSDLGNNSMSPRDHSGHGTHVAGIALGTGQAGRAARGDLFYTYHYSEIEPKQYTTHYPSPITIPGVTDFQMKAIWEGDDADFWLLSWPQGMTYGDAFNAEPSKLEFMLSLSSPGPSPYQIDGYVNGKDSYCYMPFLQSTTDAHLLDVVILSCVASYPASCDDFNKFRGVAPACKWAAVRDENDVGDPVYDGIKMGLEELRTDRITKNIKVVNISEGLVDERTNLPLEDTSLRAKVKTSALNGILVVVSAGNEANDGEDADGEDQPLRKMADPARAGFALTVGASNDRNALTAYSTYGFANPNLVTYEDYKPDLIAPGGSDYYTGIISVDTGSSDCYGRADLQTHDYAVRKGTSMAAPFVAGCAGLVIDALQQKRLADGYNPNDVWDFYSSNDALFVKMVLCATATETNQNREDRRYNPTLERDKPGRYDFPRGKDRYEGYGIVNADAAVEAVALDYVWGISEKDTFGSDPSDRRAWARTLILEPNASYKIELTNPATGDFDLYVYNAEPSATGTPVYYTEPSTRVGLGVNEVIGLAGPQQITQTGEPVPSGSLIPRDSLVPHSLTDGGEECILVVKRVIGDGEFTLRGSRTDGYGSIVGVWSLHEESGGFGSQASTSTIHFRADQTLTLSGLLTLTGEWRQSGNSVSWTYNNGTYHSGTLSSEIKMNGRYTGFGIGSGTWEATKVPDILNISGYVRTEDGDPVSGVVVMLSKSYGSRSDTTDSNGYYNLSFPSEWLPLTLNEFSASKEGYKFSEPQFSGSTINFTANAMTDENTTVTISGQVRIGGSGLVGVTIRRTDGAGFTITDSSGYYSLTVPYGWSGTIEPEKSLKYSYSPSSRYFSNVTSSQTLDFTASLILLTISGYVRVGGSGLEGVSVSGTNGAGNTTTSSSGYYSLSVPFGWSGTITPSKSGYTFSPSSKYFVYVSGIETVDFWASPIIPNP